KTAQPPSVAMRRGDDPARPETRTVSADLPAAYVVAPLGRRNPQDVLRLAARNIPRREENRKIAPHDLIPPVPVDPLGPGVPAGHSTLRVKHKDGVILDAFDQRPKAPSGLPLSFDGFPEPLKDQAGEFSEPRSQGHRNSEKQQRRALAQEWLGG